MQRIAAEIQAAEAAAGAAAPGGGGDGGGNAHAGADDRAAEEALVAAAERLADGEVALLNDLTEEEIGDVFSLVFGLAAVKRGKHWELPDAKAARIGKWVKRAIRIHGLAWLETWIPGLMALGLISYETYSRLRFDAELELAKQLPAAT